MQDLISIIIPVYNVAEYLPACLESVCSQTYQNLEIILVDDGSTDISGSICDRWAERDSRIRVIHKENGGVSSARNAGIQVSTGDLIGFVDGDDWISEYMYEKLGNAISGADIACCGFMEYPMGDMSVAIPRGTKPAGCFSMPEAALYIYQKGGYFTSIWNKLFRRQIIIQKGNIVLMDTGVSWGEDELWLSQVLSKSKKIAYVPDTLYYWRPRMGSVTREEIITKKHMTLLKAKKRAMSNLPRDKKLQSLTRVRMYDDCYSLKIIAYITSDRQNFRIIEKTLAPMKKIWIKSPDSDWKRKLKLILIEFEMKLKLPANIVRRTNNIKRYGTLT